MAKTKFHKLTSVLAALLLSAAMWSCSDDGPSSGDVTGSWYGTYAYSNNTFAYLSVDLERDGTGSTYYEAPGDRISISQFVWEKKGAKIECYGYIARYTGEVDEFEMTLMIEGDRLYPQKNYAHFILTRDDSVITYEDGKELQDESTDLSGVWINDAGGEVVELNVGNESFSIYDVDNCEPGQYYWLTEGDLSYDKYRKELTMEYTSRNIYNFVQYTVSNLTGSSLTLKAVNGNKSITYRRGSSGDVPTKFTAYKRTLEYPLTWKPKSGDYSFSFRNGTIQYSDQTSHRNGSTYTNNYLSASGTYTISGNRILAHFDRISISYYGVYPNDFSGWVNGSQRDITYQIERISSESLTIKADGGSTYTLYPR